MDNHKQNNNSSESITMSEKQTTKMEVCIDGMSCRSCEITIERQWKKLPGVKHVEINASTGKGNIHFEGEAPSVAALQHSLADEKYSVHQNKNTDSSRTTLTEEKERPSFWKLVGLFALVLVIGKILTSLGLFNTNFNVSESTSFGAIFVVGLIAAVSSCLAVVGGLLLSTTARFNEKYASQKPLARMRPVFLFVLGRITSYTVLGGLLGVVGGILSPSPMVTALLTIVAAMYMLIMGLEMLHIAPQWMKRFLPRTPKGLSHKILDAEAKEHWGMPFVLGGATFFLPCGFTQALQLYALTTGDFMTGATILLAFALGTAPALLALGYASSALKGKFGKAFFQFAGALVVVLGLWNIQNALAIAGYPISFSGSSKGSASVSETPVPSGDVQVVKMKVDPYQGYIPENITIEAGRPVRWEVDGTNASGCANVLISRKLGVQKILKSGVNIIEFTAPTTPGQVGFSCSMGMYRGNFTVVPAKS